MRDRRIARCSACNETFSYLIDITEAQLAQDPVVKLSCPFCHVPLEIDLNPYLRTTTTLLRGENEAQALSLQLPAELPTRRVQD